MEGLYQIDVKVFVAKGGDILAYDFVPVLQRWIQEHTVPGVLIDVADYSHIHHGAGVILVAHEMNISIDYNDGRMGLLYHQKVPIDGGVQRRITAVIGLALTACAQLEKEPEFAGRLAFDAGSLLIMATDRANVPNDAAGQSEFERNVREATEKLYGSSATYEARNGDTRSRAAVEVRSADASLRAALDKCGAVVAP